MFASFILATLRPSLLLVAQQSVELIGTGDSITAGFAMEDLPLEYRGSVYSTGGGMLGCVKITRADKDAFTIGNFLANYNPDIEGRCVGTTIPMARGVCPLPL